MTSQELFGEKKVAEDNSTNAVFDRFRSRLYDSTVRWYGESIGGSVAQEYEVSLSLVPFD